MVLGVSGGNTSAENVAERRFRPLQGGVRCLDGNGPVYELVGTSGPTYMKQYKQPELAVANALDAKADEEYQLGVQAGANSDSYVRDTIYLATILFLIGISGTSATSGSGWPWSRSAH